MSSWAASSVEIDWRAFDWESASEKMFCQRNWSETVELALVGVCIARMARFGVRATMERSMVCSFSR